MPAQPLKITNRKDRTMVTISGPMTVVQAVELKNGLLKAFESGKDVELSLAGLTEVDLTGLQLVCSSHKTSIQRGVRLSLAAPPPQPFCEIASLAGMQRMTGCAQDISGTCLWKVEDEVPGTVAGGCR